MSFFPRPARAVSRPQPSRPAPMEPAPPASSDEKPSGANLQGTIFAVVGLLVTALTIQGWKPSDAARYAAIGTGISIAISVAFDARRGIRNLQRADLFAILAYYFLTLFEFLFPQEAFDRMLQTDSAVYGARICILGFGGLFIGRHLLIPKKQPFKTTLTHEVPRGWMITIFWMAFFIGYSNMLFAVKFDVVAMVKWFMAPRFTQPWGRERLGGWSSLLYELNMLIQLIPPLAGIILARRHRYPVFHLLLIICALLLTLFYGFGGGTRNIFATFLVTFLIGYSLALPPGRTKELGALAIGCALVMCFATFFMLQFRDVGLENYMKGKAPPPQDTGDHKTLYVDYNLFSICKLAEFFPRTHDYLGFEIPYQALVRPIPRAIWPGKPEGLSMTIEDALNVDGLTLSASFAGEAYMSGGIFAVLAISLFLGAFMGWWGSLASPQNSEIGHLVYASGFFSAVITMRSLFVFTTALLPSLAAIFISYFVVQTVIKQGGKLLQRAMGGGAPMRPGRPMPTGPMGQMRPPPRPPARRP